MCRFSSEEAVEYVYDGWIHFELHTLPLQSLDTSGFIKCFHQKESRMARG